MRRQLLAAGWIVTAALLPACAPAEKAADAPAPAQQEATAWWKTEGQETTGGDAAAAALAGEAKPGWAKLAALDTGLAAKGAKVFDAKACASCHSIGKGTVVGPDLLGVTHRVEPDWLAAWLKNPEPYLEKDEYAKAMLAKYLVKMPNLSLTDDEVSSLTEFFRQHDAAPKKG